MGILTRATRNITRRKARALLVIVALSLALAMVIILPPSITANQEATQRLIDNLTADAEKQALKLNRVATQIDCYLPISFDFPSEANNYTSTVTLYPLMDVTAYAGLSLIPDVANVIPILRQDQRDSQGKYLYEVYGIPLDPSFVDNYPTILPSNITAGRNLQAGDSGVVVLQEIVANYFGVGVDDTVDILGQTFKVVGIQGRGSYQGLAQYNVTAAYMSLNEAQIITNTTGQATTFIVFADSIDTVGEIGNNIQTAYPNLRVELATSVINEALDLQSKATNRMHEVQNTMGQIQGTGIVQIGLAVAAQVAIILFIMLYTVRERTKEIGTLKAMGASNKTILGQFMFEGILLSLIAGVIGIAIGIVGASTLGYLLLPHLNQLGADLILTEEGQLTSAPITVTITPELILIGLGVAVLLGALGSLYPAWRAARIRPAEAMRYE